MLKVMFWGAGDMAQWLRVLIALTKDPGSVASSDCSQLSVTPVLENSVTLF